MIPPDIAALIAEAIVEGRLASGEHPARVLATAQTEEEGRVARKAILHGVTRNARYQRQPNWTSEELQFLDAHAATMSVQQIAAALGRSPNSVKVKRVRRGLPSVTRNPDYYSARDIALMLGVSCSKTVTRWIEEGRIKPMDVELDCGWSLVPWERIARFAVNPDNWVLFDTKRVKDPRLCRLIALRQDRWQDAWLTTKEAAAWYNTQHPGMPLVEPSDIRHVIARGRLTGVQKGVGNSSWFVRRSHLVDFVIYKGGKGAAKRVRLSADAIEYLLLAQALGITKRAIAANMGLACEQTIYNYLAIARKNAQRLIRNHQLDALYRPRQNRLYADWSHHARRFPTLARAMRRFLADEPKLSNRDRLLVRAWLYSWAAWHATPHNVAQEKLVRRLHHVGRNSAGECYNIARLHEIRKALIAWYPPDSAESLPLRPTVLETL